jgi:zinc/manganese transport system substrate-binding protein
MAGMRRIALLATILAAVVAVAGCNGSGDGRTATGELKVVAAENFWGNLAQQIGGSHVAVTSLITNPAADPHEFTSNTADQLAVATAGLVVVNGAGYDGFMAKLLAAAPSSHRQVVTVADALHVTASNNPNPHLWYDVDRLPSAITAIADGLIAADPTHAAAYRQGAARTIAAVRPLQRAVQSLRRRYAGTPVAYTERLPGYLLDDAGLRVVTPAGFARSIEAGTDPSFADTAAMRAVLGRHRARLLVYNAQAASPVTGQLQALARATGIPVVSVTETMPAGSTFESWQLSQVNSLSAALAKAGGR